MKNKSNQQHIVSNRIIRYILLICGSIFVGLGLIGIVLPLLPTTPFLLLAAACYARSSKRFYNWLFTNKWFGSYLKNYYEGKGIPLLMKMFILFLLWVTIALSIILLSHLFWVKHLLVIIAIAVSIHIMTIKTYQKVS